MLKMGELVGEQSIVQSRHKSVMDKLHDLVLTYMAQWPSG